MVITNNSNTIQQVESVNIISISGMKCQDTEPELNEDTFIQEFICI